MEHHASAVHHDGSAPRKKDGKSNLMIALGAVAVILVIVAVANFGGSLFGGGMKAISPDEAKARAEKFVNENLVSGTTATITEVTDYSDSLYKLSVQVGENSIESFITKDGKQFFPQAMDIDAPLSDTVASTTPAAPVVPADLPKNDKPVVEVFVMSHCPYGTQMEKGLLPVADVLKDKMDLQIKFVNYAMHGEKEVKEQLYQYCIEKEEETKFFPYLKCFLKAGDTAGCTKEAGLNEGKVNSCVEKADKEFKISDGLNDRTKWTGSFPPFAIYDAENTKYGVQGSPTLVINGKTVESNRDSQSLLSTICAAFNNAPEECQQTLPSGTPTPGFGEGTQASTGGSADAACAPVAM